MRKSLAVVFLITACASRVFAWGAEGHRIVCRIAFLSLSPQDQKEVARLTTAYQTPPGTELVIDGFPTACVFPDEARRKAVDAQKTHDSASRWNHFAPFNEWHFLNVGRSVTAIPATACGGNCVIFGIEQHSHALQTSKNDQDRAEALIFLGHWVGDVHQPLHVSYKDDGGGNSIEPVTGGFYPVPKIPEKPDAKLNLHSVWDTSIIRKDIPTKDVLAFADALHAKITSDQRKTWLSSTPLQWAQESYDITTGSDVQYCKKLAAECKALPANARVLKQGYQKEFAPDIELRLEQAGTRLAAVIAAALHPK